MKFEVISSFVVELAKYDIYVSTFYVFFFRLYIAFCGVCESGILKAGYSPLCISEARYVGGNNEE
jgi:hypothetical protein